MRRFVALPGLVAAGVILAACTEGPAPAEPTLEPAFSAGPVVELVTGSGSFVVPGPDDWRTFAFTARRHADGTVSGQWERIRRQPGNASGTKSHGVVTCFTVIGNQVWLGGTTTSGLFSEPPNNENAWRVVDNGQGAAAPADQMSLEFVGGAPGFAANYCALTPATPPLLDLTAGNITIH